MNIINIIISIIIMALITFLARAFPFIFFRTKKPSEMIVFIGKYAPFSIITILVIYCLKDISFSKPPFGLNEFIAILFVIFLHLKFRNFFVSIFLSTFIFMLLVQLNLLRVFHF
ncbi:branched-chain amino acid transport [Thermodesulfobium narugense DSM 14796]|uniref:Branched-chain amino acid transport n=1 Tax=Thermodesulfobium narugense DSM 14796 TaxID=747365 RepID=M1E8L7_9BACT|nr:AzlD domain-containing protein [Thermodesulfobium narugense]AEE14549.1 branched-chain amino acid transport [Thermodesulfobium narugense DSM 14796]